MTIVDVSQRRDSGLPQALRTAQEAIHLPEVQEMLRRLSEYKLGVFMPHMHDEHTGEFQALPDEVTQLESGLKVSFQRMAELANQTDHFLGLACRCIDPLGSVRNGFGRRSGRYGPPRQTQDA